MLFYFSHLRFAKEIRSKIPFLFLLERIMTKQIFTQSQQVEEEEILPKQEFHNVEITIVIFKSRFCASLSQVANRVLAPYLLFSVT